MPSWNTWFVATGFPTFAQITVIKTQGQHIPLQEKQALAFSLNLLFLAIP
jgi:hypothetical protein